MWKWLKVHVKEGTLAASGLRLAQVSTKVLNQKDVDENHLCLQTAQAGRKKKGYRLLLSHCDILSWSENRARKQTRDKLWASPTTWTLRLRHLLNNKNTQTHVCFLSYQISCCTAGKLSRWRQQTLTPCTSNISKITKISKHSWSGWIEGAQCSNRSISASEHCQRELRLCPSQGGICYTTDYACRRHVKMGRLNWQKHHSEIQHPSKETPDATPSDVWSAWWPYSLIPCPKSDRNTRCVPGNLPALLLRQKRRCPCACLSQQCQFLREH